MVMAAGSPPASQRFSGGRVRSSLNPQRLQRIHIDGPALWNWKKAAAAYTGNFT
jgi:hypothetical protein